MISKPNRKFDRVHNVFFTEFKTKEFLLPLSQMIEKTDEDTSCIIQAFMDSLETIINVLSLPKIIALSHYLQQLLDSFLQKEWIDETAERLIKENEKGKRSQSEQKTEATKLSESRKEKALKSFSASLETEQGKKSTWNGTYLFLDSLIDWQNMETAPFDLLCQGIILLWSAFEVFFRDSFCNLVNRKPEKTKLIMDSPRLRNRLPFKGVTFEV